MILKKKYVDINDTLSHIRLQVREGIEYSKQNVPLFISPVELYYWLKIRTRYKNDPEGIELLQSLPTLLEDNYWGMSGFGDCDCFSLATLTVLQKQKFKCKSWIKLAGRNKNYPVHIWAGCDYKGEELALDLTNHSPGEERKYKYIQKIYFQPL